MRSSLLSAILGAGLLCVTTGAASAHEPRGAAGPVGNGPHDYAPHWHKTLTPFGPRVWYGNGPHDALPHGHSATPWGGVRSYSYTPFGPTKSYNGFPGYGNFSGSGRHGRFGFRPFGGYRGYFSPWSGW